MPKRKAPSTLSGHAAEIFESAYEAAWKAYDPKKSKAKSQEEYAAKVAWAAVKNKYKKNKDGKWVKKARALRGMAFDLRITKARTDEDGTVRWHANAANDEVDEDESEILDPSLFDDLAYNFDMVMKAYADNAEIPDFGHGPALEPILDLAHYSCIVPLDKRDSARVGAINKLYRDGRYLHATGVFDNTPQGKLASKAVLEDEGGIIRTSVGFYPDWGNIKIVDDLLYWMGGREPPKAYLDHIAVTTVPRIESTTIEAGEGEVTMSDSEVLTMADDAKQILGDEGEAIIEELEGLVEGMKGKSMVLKAEAEVEDKVEDEIKVKAEVGGPDKCVCPDCDYEAEKKRGTPCREMECPECGANLVAGSNGSKEKSEVSGSADSVTGHSDLKAEVVTESEAEVTTVVEETLPIVEEVVAIDADDLYEIEAIGEIKKESDVVVTVPEEAVEMVVQKPFGGATSFEEAIEWNEATTEKWRVMDGWYIFQEVMNNILSDDEIEDRPLAISKALAEFQAFLTSGKKVWSRVEDDDMETEEITVIDEQLPVEPTEVTPVEEPEVVEPVEIEPAGEVLCGIENLASEVATGPTSLGVEPPEATPVSMVEDPGLRPVQGVAKSFADAVERLAQAGMPRNQRRQAVSEMTALAETQINEALDTTSGIDVEALVNDVVGAAIAPVQAELAEINTLLRQVVSQSDVSEPVAPRRPQRKSHVPKPNIKPARVTTMAKTFSEVVDRLCEQRYG